MIDYDGLRGRARTGDVLIQEGRGLVAVLIRVLTGQQASHVALILRMNDGLFVAEVRGSYGFTVTPASQRVPEMCRAGYLYFGCAPSLVRNQPEIVLEQALRLRARPYSYRSLILVWLAQLLRRHVPAGLVCSTAVQQVWEDCGVPFLQTPDPGDYLRLADEVHSVVCAE